MPASATTAATTAAAALGGNVNHHELKAHSQSIRGIQAGVAEGGEEVDGSLSLGIIWVTLKETVTGAHPASTDFV